MLSLSRKTDYAILIVTALAKRPAAFLSLRALAAERHLPYRSVAHVVRPLTSRGILESREGLHGGYRLARAPREITIQDIVAAEEGGVALASCLDPRRGYGCPQLSVCPARQGLPRVQQLVLRSLAQYTIEDLLREEGHG